MQHTTHNNYSKLIGKNQYKKKQKTNSKEHKNTIINSINSINLKEIINELYLNNELFKEIKLNDGSIFIERIIDNEIHNSYKIAEIDTLNDTIESTYTKTDNIIRIVITDKENKKLFDKIIIYNITADFIQTESFIRKQKIENKTLINKLETFFKERKNIKKLLALKLFKSTHNITYLKEKENSYLFTETPYREKERAKLFLEDDDFTHLITISYRNENTGYTKIDELIEKNEKTIENIKKGLKRFFDNLKKTYKTQPKYVWTIETTKAGLIHIHMITKFEKAVKMTKEKFLKLLKTTAKQFNTHIIGVDYKRLKTKQDKKKAIQYVMKYLNKSFNSITNILKSETIHRDIFIIDTNELVKSMQHRAFGYSRNIKITTYRPKKYKEYTKQELYKKKIINPPVFINRDNKEIFERIDINFIPRAVKYQIEDPKTKKTIERIFYTQQRQFIYREPEEPDAETTQILTEIINSMQINRTTILINTILNTALTTITRYIREYLKAINNRYRLNTKEIEKLAIEINRYIQRNTRREDIKEILNKEAERILINAEKQKLINRYKETQNDTILEKIRTIESRINRIQQEILEEVKNIIEDFIQNEDIKDQQITEKIAKYEFKKELYKDFKNNDITDIHDARNRILERYNAEPKSFYIKVKYRYKNKELIIEIEYKEIKDLINDTDYSIDRRALKDTS